MSARRSPATERTVVGSVVVAIGEGQPALVDFAAREASRRSTSLRVVHATLAAPTTAAPEFGDCLGMDPAGLEGAAACHVIDEARLHVASTAPGLEASFVLRTGSVLDVVQTESRTASEVVIGQDGDLPRYWWLFDGHSTERFAARATVPVTVVPPEWHDRGGDVVLYLKDLSRCSLDLALRAAQDRSCGLEIVHVAGVGQRDAHWAARRRLIDEWSSKWPDVDVRVTVVDHGSLADAIEERATQASLLVIGVPLRLHVPWAIDHSVLRSLVLHTGVPLTLVPR